MKTFFICMCACLGLWWAVAGCGGDSGGGDDPSGDTDTDTDADTDTDTDADTDTDTDADSDSDSDSDADIPDECTPTEVDEGMACTPEGQCCNFPSPDGEPEVEWADGDCVGRWESGGTSYEIDCEGVDGEEPECWCEVEEAADTCEPSSQELDEACTPTAACCDHPDPDGDVIGMTEEDGCLGAWETGDTVYVVECDGGGTEDAICECSMEDAHICAPTNDDPEQACQAANQCCGFPQAADEFEGDDWEGGCEMEYESGNTHNNVMCEQLGTADAWCFCVQEM